MIQLPESQEAERSVISMLMNETVELLPKAKALAVTADLFHTPAHGILFDAVSKLAGEEIAVELTALHEYLKSSGNIEQVGGPGGLVDILNTSSTAANFEHYVEELRQLKAKRDLVTTLTKSTESANDRRESPQETLRMLTESVESIRATLTPPQSFKRAKESCAEFLQAIEERSKSQGEVSGIATGIPALDLVTGGMRPRELWVTAGPTSAGKSALSLQLAAATIRSGKSVLIFSLEMGTEEVFGRLVSHCYRVPMGSITMTKTPTKADLEKMKSACEEMPKWPFAICDHAGMTMDHIEAFTQQFSEEQELGLIVVDYVQLIEGKRLNGETREQELARYVKRLKQLAKRYDCAVVTPSQLNDDGRVRESREIANSADVLAIIGEDKVTLAKNRNGQRDVTLNIELNGETQTFRES